MADARRDVANRPDGYYWVLFNWTLFDPGREPSWQPASWDQRVLAWALIGSRQIVPFDQPCILDVDERAIERLPEASA